MAEVRWILIEVFPHLVEGSNRMAEYFERVFKRHGANTAKVAGARKMLRIIYYRKN